MIDNNRARKWPLIAGLFSSSHKAHRHLFTHTRARHQWHRTCYSLRSVLWLVVVLLVVRCCSCSAALCDAVRGVCHVDAVHADPQPQGCGLCSQDRHRQGTRQQRHRAWDECPAPHVRDGAPPAPDGHAHVCLFSFFIFFTSFSAFLMYLCCLLFLLAGVSGSSSWRIS